MGHKKSLRILIISLNYAPEPTGIAPYVASLAKGLAAHGNDVRVKTTHPHYPEWRIADGYGRWSQTEFVEDVEVQRLRHYVPTHPTGLQRVLSEVSFGLRAAFTRWGRPDIVVLVSPALFATAIATLRLRFAPRVIPHVVWVQDLYGLGVSEIGGGKAAALVSAFESRVVRSANGVAVIHERFAAHMKTRLGVMPSRVQVVRNWTHLDELALPAKEATRKTRGWRPNQTVVLHAGNMGVKQDLTNVVNAARLSRERGEDVLFVLLGNGNQRSTLETVALGVPNIQFIDPLPDLEYQATMAAADMLLVNEKVGVAEMAVPSKLTSYFSTGLPVIAATDEGSVTAAEIATSGGGVRVDAGDPMALLEAVTALMRDPQRARDMGRRGILFRREVLSECAAIKNYETWLTSIVRSS